MWFPLRIFFDKPIHRARKWMPKGQTLTNWKLNIVIIQKPFDLNILLSGIILYLVFFYTRCNRRESYSSDRTGLKMNNEWIYLCYSNMHFFFIHFYLVFPLNYVSERNNFVIDWSDALFCSRNKKSMENLKQRRMILVLCDFLYSLSISFTTLFSLCVCLKTKYQQQNMNAYD